MPKNKKIVLLVALLWTCIITMLSLVSFSTDIGNSIPVPYKDKYVHFAFYFVFVVFWCYFVKRKTFSTFTNIIIVIFAIEYGILMEICQGIFTKNRMPDITDIYANSTGALLGFVFIILFNTNKKATH